MKKKTLIIRSILPILVVILTAGASVPAADSSPDNTASPGSSSARAPIYTDGQAARSGTASSSSLAELDSMGGDPRVLAYWTKERMANAIPVDTRSYASIADSPVNNISTKEVVTESAKATQTSSTQASPQQAAAAPVTKFPASAGKVYFRNQSDGGNYMCSGSALNSGSKRLVATAGHCVHGGGNGATWHANWIFIPSYDSGTRPHGTFAAYTMRTMDDWINYGASSRGFNSDVAFVTTSANENGAKVVDAVGGNGIITGGSEYNTDVTLFGYPGNLDRGERMYACWGTTTTAASDGYRYHKISGCDFGGGASGGPWIRDYNNDSQLGYLKSVSSFGPRDDTSYIAGPYFRDDMRTLYTAANADG